jgi:biopolymer transport protein ExbD
MKRRRRKTGAAAGFNITPMIDMTFLLLIFFMVTSKLSKEQVKMEIALPIAEQASFPDSVQGRDIINIDAAGLYYIGNRQVEADELQEWLTARYHGMVEPPYLIYLRMDAQSPSARLKKFMQIALEAGAHKVIIGTHNR